MCIFIERGFGFGVGGNAGYEFIPRANVMRNYNNEYAGLVRWITFRELNTSHMLVNKYDGSLGEKHYEGDDPLAVDDGYIEEPTAYFMGQKEISKEDYSKALVSGDYEDLIGSKSFANMNAALDGMINIK